MSLATAADVLVLAPNSHFLGTKQFDVLHGDFGYPVRAAMQVSQVIGQRCKIESRRLGGGRFLRGSFLNGGFRERFLFLSPFGIDRRRCVNRGVGGRLGRLVLSRFDFGFVCGFCFRLGWGRGDGCGVIGVAVLSRVESDGNEIREDGKSRSKRRCCRLRAQHGRKRVARAARRTGRDQIGVRLMQFVRGPLQRSEIVAQCPRNSLLEGMLERFGTFGQDASLPFAIMETRLGGVN